MTDATLTAAEGVGDVHLSHRSVFNIPRILYLYENRGVEPLAVHSSTTGRSLYLYENRGIEALEVETRDLYLYENRGIEDAPVLARALYLHEVKRDGEPFPWLMAIDPTEQVRGGQISLLGDGFGEVVERAADVGNVVTTSSVSGGNVGGNAIDRATPEWVSTSGAGAWLRITFAAPRNVIAIALTDLVSTLVSWGNPEFRFSDGGANVAGVGTPARPDSSVDVPVGGSRTLYTLPAARTTDYVEVRVASAGAGTNRGLSEVWVYTDEDDDAEDSAALSNLGLAAETLFGIVSWSNRSPGLYPANGGLPITPAAVVTVANDAESGLVKVREST